MFGDPHFITFDGNTNPKFMDESLNRFWAVKSDSVKIQGIASGSGSWMQGIAISGGAIGSHVLVATRDPNNYGAMRVLWNGHPILAKSGDSLVANGIELRRGTGATYLPPEDELKKIFGTAGGAKNFFNMGNVLEAWITGKDVYTFKFPGKIEIHMLWSRLPGEATAEVLLKMPPQAKQGGWCGNFNGNPGDDAYASDRQALTPEEDLFAKSGLTLAQLDQMANLSNPEIAERQDKSGTPPPCEGEIRDMAEHACGHIKETTLRNACIDDVCISRRFKPATNAADDIAIMKTIHIMSGNKKCVPVGNSVRAQQNQMQQNQGPLSTWGHA